MRSTRIGEYSLSPLSFAQLPSIARGLDAPELRKWIASEHSATFFEAITKRLAAELEGRSLLLVIQHQKRVVGLVGLSDYPGLYGSLQTSTYLHPDYWGSGLNNFCKHLLWSLGHELLAHGSMVASIDLENTRSQAALRRQFPGAPERTIYEFWRPRQAQLFEICAPPTGESPLTPANLRALRRLLRRVPAWQRWLVRPVGKKTLVQYTQEAEVLHTENLYTAVARVLSEQASMVSQLARQVADASAREIPALLDEASELASEAQHHAAERMVELASEAESMSGASQEMIAEAIIELREDAGLAVSQTQEEEIRHQLQAGLLPGVPEPAPVPPGEGSIPPPG